MQDEINIMYERRVWKLVDLPNGVQPLGSRWVYTIKYDESGKIACYKARLVAQGYRQVKGDSYDGTFSPVVNFSIIRFFFAILVSYQKWTHIQCDVKGAYLYAPINDNIFMSQPSGFVVKGKEGMVCKLEKALYGLHQSGRMWYFELHRVLIQLGFCKLEWSNCVYTFKNDIVLLLYVDDFVIFGKTKDCVHKIVTLLGEHFDLKILGRTRKLLGIEFEEEGNSVFLNQSHYIDDVCNRFKSFKFPISSLPISKGIVYSKAQCPQSNADIEEMLQYPYRSVLGCLSFIAGRTRPDISYAVNIFSQFQSNPGIVHWQGLLKLLGYVQYTKHLKLNLTCNKLHLITYTDADFAANRDDRTSMGGQLVLIDKSPVAWRTFKQKTVSLSTMESEFIAMTEATKELVWFDRIINECFKKKILYGQKVKPNLLVDNMAAIDFIKSPIENYRTKHIDVKLFFVRDLINQDIFEVKHVRSKANLSDVFTKPLTKFDLDKFKSYILI